MWGGLPIPEFSLLPSPETITAAEAVGMVMQRFGSSGCTEAEAGMYLTKRVQDGKLKLSWTESSPEYPYGRPNGLFLGGDNSFDGANGSPIYLPGFPGARALDELDWDAGLLRRRVRWPKLIDRDGRDIDAAALSDYERQRAEGDIIWTEYEADLPADQRSPLAILERTEWETRAALREYLVREWIIEELTYPFTVKRASLVAVVDPVRVPLLEAIALIALHRNISAEEAWAAFVDAAANKRIKVYGKPHYPELGSRIRARVWRRVLLGEIALSADAPTVSAKPAAGRRGHDLWSDPYVFRTDLEPFLPVLPSEGVGWESEIACPQPTKNAAECEIGRGTGSLEPDDHEKTKPDRDTMALRGEAKKWLAARVKAGEHRDRDSTLDAMRKAHPGRTFRGSKAVWAGFVKENRELHLSRRGPKLKRNTNN